MINSLDTAAHFVKRGFALVACLILLALMVVVAVGLLGLSAIELRNSGVDQSLASARANARLALMMALDQLQRELGPDQRVSAPASLLENARQSRWTGVWSSRREDGSPMWARDPVTGSLTDGRNETGWEPTAGIRAWLVSGKGDPTQNPADGVELVGQGSVGSQADAMVKVPSINLEGTTPGTRGRMAWWVGDLGQRANLAVSDAHAGHRPDPAEPGKSGYFRLMASQQADSSMMAGGRELSGEIRERLASEASAALANSPSWTRERFHDFTVHSAGVLADPRDGGLKKDLTAFLNSAGQVPAESALEGLSVDDPVFDKVAGSRLRHSSPCFGVLYNWARPVAAFDGRNVPAAAPQVDSRGGDPMRDTSRSLALCNEAPATIRNLAHTSLQPVVVEASAMMQISVYQDRTVPSSGGGMIPMFQVRQHNYPRVVLWNPYNVELRSQPLMVMIQGNGRQEVWTEDVIYDKKGNEIKGFKARSQWLFFEGGRSTLFAGPIMQSAGYNDPYIGSYYYSIPASTFGPGDCLVFTPARSAEYDGLSVYRPGSYDLSKNELSCEVAPDVSRSYYVSSSEINGGIKTRPVRFWFEATPAWSEAGRRGVENQSDDTRVVVKALVGGEPVTFERFDQLPQVAYLSGSLQYGAGREPRVAWNINDPMVVELLEKDNPRPMVEPNVRTREGLRLRWFVEPLSNRLNAGELTSRPSVFEEALLANWNPRAAYAVRSPRENLAGSMPKTGSGGGPWFFGAYTRDLFDPVLGWDGQVPVYRGGRQHGNPFGPPQEGAEHHVVFELPRAETGVISLGQFQHAKLSEFVWHPSFAIGNSLVDPRFGGNDLVRTVPSSSSVAEDRLGGFSREAIGWSTDSQRGKDRDEWANTARALLQGLPDTDQVLYDLSFEANHALWDRFFLSTGGPSAMAAMLGDPAGKPLPNGRIKPAPHASLPSDGAAIADYHRAARHLMVDGTFNVNSTSVEAWKALLAATRNIAGQGAGYRRVLHPLGGSFKAGDDPRGAAAWSGIRELSDEEITRLATAIVEEVKTRGPFLSLSDFVNRRLRNHPTGRAGALQSAIDRAGINSGFDGAYPLNNSSSLPDYRHPDNIQDATRLEQTLKPACKAWGAPGFLTQGDLLQVLGPALNARSDTFVIRAYGEAKDPAGRVAAKAWCEAVVQRTPEPIHPDASGLNPAMAGRDGDFGRHFAIMSFRWLRQNEI